MNLSAYLRRIGLDVPARPTLDMLKGIAARQPRAIPFENLDPWLGKPVSLALADVEEKLVERRRGGYCFEQNTLLLAALREIGFDAQPLAARVEWMAPPGAPPRGRTHILIRVMLDGEAWLADAGFGGMTLTDALRFIPDIEQGSDGDRMRLLRQEDEWQLSAFVSGRWEPMYRFDLQPQFPSDQAMANHFVSTHPQSQFVTDLIVARATGNGRHALRNRDLAFYPGSGTPERRRIESSAALRAVLADIFQIDLANVEGLGRRIESLFAEE
jgi:N-hydroxyarylamine O-acetyltransferase